MLGDGGIHNPWQATITVNAVADKTYAEYISALCERLFGFRPSVYKRKTREALVIRISSTSVADFLVKKGLVRGNKLRAGAIIPSWILKKKAYRIACVRGLVDTDGCLFIHKHTIGGRMYQNIGLTFTGYSRELLGQVAAIVEEIGVIPHITKRERDIYLYSAAAVARYLAVVGTSNSRIDSVYAKWRGARAVE